MSCFLSGPFGALSLFNPGSKYSILTNLLLSMENKHDGGIINSTLWNNVVSTVREHFPLGRQKSCWSGEREALASFKAVPCLVFLLTRGREGKSSTILSSTGCNNIKKSSINFSVFSEKQSDPKQHHHGKIKTFVQILCIFMSLARTIKFKTDSAGQLFTSELSIQ